jgi:hypothetical protein
VGVSAGVPVGGFILASVWRDREKGDSHMTEQLADLAVMPTAEQILGSIPHNGVKEILAAAERRQRRMNSELDDIESDEDLSLEGKQRRAQQTIDRHAEEIAQTYRDARARVEASAETSYKFSLPFPDKKTFAQARIADSSEELAVQGRANDIAARIAGKSLQEVTKERSKNPNDKGMQETRDSRLGALRSEFDAAMSAGGVEGRIRALALARVCEGMGVPLEDVVGHHRTQTHLNALAEVMKPLSRLVAEAYEEHQQEKQAYETDVMIAEATKAALKDELKRAAREAAKSGDRSKIDEIARRSQDAEVPEEPLLRRYKTEDATVEKISEILLENPRGILVHRDELWLAQEPGQARARRGSLFLPGELERHGKLRRRPYRQRLATRPGPLPLYPGQHPARTPLFLRLPGHLGREGR